MVRIEILNFHEDLSLFFLEFSKESAKYGYRLPKFFLEKNQFWVLLDLDYSKACVELCYVFHAIGKHSKETGLKLDFLIKSMYFNNDFHHEKCVIRVNNIDPKLFIISVEMTKDKYGISINWNKMHYWEGLVAIEFETTDTLNLMDIFCVFANIGHME